MGHANLLDPDTFTTALSQNREWAAKTARQVPTLFPKLATGQTPEILWIGCSDSRCPETTILGLQPGDVFVHRNIANIVHPGDINAAAVIEYAVKYLKVKHVVLCGHTCCGGVAAALGNGKLGLIDTWLLPLRRLRMENLPQLKALTTDRERADKMTEWNVRRGVETLKENDAIIDAMRERGLRVHGCIYDVASGSLHEIDTMDGEDDNERRFEAFWTRH